MSTYSALAGDLLADLLIGIDHIAICVRDLDEAGSAWSALLGQPIAHREDVVTQKTTAAFLPTPRGAECAALELISPMPGNVGLVKFLDRRGDGIHHIAFAVTDIRAALERLRAANVRLIDQEPRAGACGHTVAFIHPKAMGGTLIELVQHAADHG
jgi:methylmalonyl-CoA/ethylmalonyl-CoA epimerase